MDKNYITGIVLIMVLFIAYFWFFSPTPPPVDQTITSDSTYAPGEKTTLRDEVGTQPQIATSNPSDSYWNQQDTLKKHYKEQYGIFAVAAEGEAKDIIIENKQVRITLNTKGGKVKEVMLKEHKTYNKKPLILLDEQSSTMAFEFQTNAAARIGNPSSSSRTGIVNLSELYFKTYGENTFVNKAEKSISLVLNISPNQYIEQVYTLPEEGYLLKLQIKFIGLDNVVKNEPVKFSWTDKLKKVESDLKESRYKSTLNYYYNDGDFDYLSERSDDPEQEPLDKPLKWISMKQRFFSAAFISENYFPKGKVSSYIDLADSNTVKTLIASLDIPIEDLKTGEGRFKFYFGPNDYHILKNVTAGFDNNVDLGWWFIPWFNKLLIIPVFNFLEGYTSNYGLIILLLVLIIKTLLFPLTYKSYVSMGKMRVLKPETDAIKEKYKDDMKAAQQEQMKLFQNVGVNPLSGCIPMLVQMPFFFAMFFFFPNSIELRQESFLWAHDLSTYDSIYDLPFTIPFYGSHISLFTILMTISTLVYTYINSQAMSSQMQGPMKTMQYIMPIMFLFILNSFSAALTYYYFLQNLITIGQQMIIRRFVDDEKIRQKLDDYKIQHTTKKKSGFRQKIEAAVKGKSNGLSFKERYYQEMRKKKDKK
ncbi:MAG: membrane protein insertase YidC [Cytophagales bacterium]|nr:membrane protein insertase YidC [Cytophagales bacterium]